MLITGYGGNSGGSVSLVVGARNINGLSDIIWEREWVKNLLGGRNGSGFHGILVVGVINHVVIGGLETSDVGLGVDVVVKIGVDVEVIWLDVADDGDVRRFGDIPKLEAGHFTDDDGMLGELVEYFDGRDVHIADEIDIFVQFFQNGFGEGASATFAFGAGNTDDGAGTMVEKISGDRGKILDFWHWWDGGTTKD